MKELKEIKFANDFMQAFPLLQEKQFDFVVVDINLPGDYNGLDILKILRRMPGYENIPVIAVSAYLLPGDRERFIHAGFSDFISKPVFREKLLSSLEKLFMPQA
jgi:CheY-like chemotaxis protein